MYMVHVSKRFVYLSLSAFILFAFIIGRAARIILLEGPRQALLAPHDKSVMFVRPDYHEGINIGSSPRKRNLPTPMLMEGKELPRTLYTGKNFDTAASATVSSLYLEREIDISFPKAQKEERNIDDVTFDKCPANEKGENQCTRGNTYEEESLHLPAGQHLLVDIKNVDGNFLNSEERLAQAMVEVITESKLTLLSYHCHSLVPFGVSCVGVLLESHISFHTWPEEGVITLDLFTCGSAPLVPVMPMIKRLFGVPRELDLEGEVVEEPIFIWSHKLRGWGSGGGKAYLAADLGGDVLEKMKFDMKEEIVSTQTKFQRIDIYDIIHPDKRDHLSYVQSLSNDGSYQATHPELYRPDRTVFLDGIHQSSRYGLEPYHEALVHPAMFTHPKPKMVAIIGGGECATLHEVLKHDTIEKVKMIEIDEEMVNVSHTYLQDWSDCSDLKGSANWCGDDSRVELYYEDALSWFINRFGDNDVDNVISDKKLVEEPFDVLIMDALDPQDNVPFAEVLYKNDVFLKALYNSLSDDGVMVLQLGMAPGRVDPSEEFSRNINRAHLIKSLEEIGFQSLNIYQEAHCLFERPWTYIVAMKNSRNRQLWYQNRAELDLAIHQRIRHTHSGEPALKYFDSVTMQSYEIPNKVFETVHCRKDPTPDSCYNTVKEIDGYMESVPISDLKVQMSTVGERSGRGLFTKVDIEAGSPVGMKEVSNNVYFAPSTVATINSAMSTIDDTDVVYVFEYIDGYGWQVNYRGKEEYGVDASIMTFSNHGCNGTHNVDGEEYWYEESLSMTEENFNIDNYKEDIELRDVYDPALDRHIPHMINSIEYVVRDIEAGEEIVSNYLSYTARRLHLPDNVSKLRAICNGEIAGYITKLEEVAMKESESEEIK